MRFFNNFAAALLTVSVLALAASCDKPEDEQKDPQNETPEEGKTEVKTPVIKAEALFVEAAAGTYEIPITVENPTEGKVLSMEIQGDAPAWLKVTATTASSITVDVTEDNLAAARAVDVKLKYEGATEVNTTLTQKQWAYSEFNISITNVGPFGATFTIERKAGYHGGYFFEVLDKSAYDRYVAGEKNKIGDFAYGDAIYQSDLAYLHSLAQQHGHALGQLFSMLGSMYSKEDKVTMPYSGLSTNTEYMFIVYGMEDSDAATRKTAMCFYSFKTGYSSDSNLQFTGMAYDITENYATIKVTPSNNSEYWYMNWASEIQLQTTDLATIMQNSINSAKSLLGRYSADQILCHGPEEIQATELMPGTEYSVIAWGMNLSMAATTEPKVVFKFKTSDYEIIDDCTFDIEVLEIEDMDVRVRVTPTNMNTRYYVAFVEKSRMEGYTDEQAAQRLINMEASRIDNGYYNVENLSWANLPGLEPGIREIWGRRDEGWTFQPNHDYRIYVFGIDNFGIRSTVVNAIDVTTADAGESSNHFQVTIESNTWLGLEYTVTPEIDDEYWMPFVAETSDIDNYFRNADGSLKEQELFHWIEEYYEDEILYYSYHGTRTLKQHVTPDTNYSIFIFGYSGTYTTKINEWNVYVPKPPIGKSTADFSYTYELFRGEDLADIDSRIWPHADFDGDCVMVVKIKPTDNAAHWYWGIWPPKENFQDQGGIYYLMTLDMNPDVSAVDKTYYRTRPWWYGVQENYKWVDEEGDIVNHYPWTISGWAEDAEGNYGPWHYNYFIPVPVPKGQETGKYEVGYDQAYNFWSNPSAAPMQVYRVSDGSQLLTPMKQ